MRSFSFTFFSFCKIYVRNSLNHYYRYAFATPLAADSVDITLLSWKMKVRENKNACYQQSNRSCGVEKKGMAKNINESPRLVQDTELLICV